MHKYYADYQNMGRHLSKGEKIPISTSVIEFCNMHTTGCYIIHTESDSFICYNGDIYSTYYVPYKLIHSYEEINDIPDNFLVGVPQYYISSKETGLDILKYIANIIQSDIKYTKNREPWIRIKENQYASVVDILVSRYPDLHFNNDIGSPRSILTNKSKGIRMILRHDYLWDKSNS